MVRVKILLAAIALVGTVVHSATAGEEAQPEPYRYEGRTLSQWAEGLSSDDPAVVVETLEVFCKIGPMASELAGEIERFLERDDEQTRLAAARALIRIKLRHEGAVKALSAMAASEDPEIRGGALRGLGEATTGARPAFGIVIGAMKDPVPGVRREAVRAVPNLGGHPAETASALAAVLSGDVDEKVRREAAFSLGRMGERAEPAIPALVKALGDGSPQVRSFVIRALPSVGPKILPQLTDLLDSPDPLLRLRAVEAIGGLREKAEPALPELMAALKDSSFDVRRAACWDIGQLGPAGKPAVPVLIDLLGGPPEGRPRAIDALGAIGSAAAEAVEPLIAAMDADEAVRFNVIRALGMIGPAAAEKAGRRLQALKKDSDPHIRRAAAEALASMGIESDSGE